MADVTFPAVTVRSRTPTSCHLPANHTCMHLESHPGWAFDGACARRPHQLLEHKAPVACGQHAEFTGASWAGGLTEETAQGLHTPTLGIERGWAHPCWALCFSRGVPGPPP